MHEHHLSSLVERDLDRPVVGLPLPAADLWCRAVKAFKSSPHCSIDPRREGYTAGPSLVPERKQPSSKQTAQ